MTGFQNVTKNRIQEKKSLEGFIYGEAFNRMYFGPITGAVAYKWVGKLIRGGGGWLISRGAYTWGGGAYKRQFPVPGLKTTSDVTHKKTKGSK